jgi:hypothetical protein
VIEGVRFAHTVLSVCLSVDSQVALYFNWLGRDGGGGDAVIEGVRFAHSPVCLSVCLSVCPSTLKWHWTSTGWGVMVVVVML